MIRTFSSPASTPVATWSSCVRDSYSVASISSSLRMESGCLTLSFLILILREFIAKEWGGGGMLGVTRRGSDRSESHQPWGNAAQKFDHVKD